MTSFRLKVLRDYAYACGAELAVKGQGDVAERFYLIGRKLTDELVELGGNIAQRNTFGWKISSHALWVGLHYSEHNRRLCVNILPGVTLWYVKRGGRLP